MNSKKSLIWFFLSVFLLLTALSILIVGQQNQNLTKQRSARLLMAIAFLTHAYRANLQQGQGAEWFNLYGYLLYHSNAHWLRQGDGPVAVQHILPKDHPCACAPLDHGWVVHQNGLTITGLTSFWDYPMRDIMVPFCIDINGPAPPNRSGSDVFIGRLFRPLDKQIPYFDWQTNTYGCSNQNYTSVQRGLK